MDFGMEDIQDRLSTFMDDLIRSKMYWIGFVAVLLAFTYFSFGEVNFAHPKMEIAALILLSFLSVIIIACFQSNRGDNDLYRSAFVIILVFGIVFSFVTPICFGPDDVEHFARSEMTSRADFLPDYTNGTYHTIQSTLDLIEVGKYHHPNGFESTSLNSTVFNTDADTKPINHTLVEYPNAFAQNPFFGYLAQAMGIFLAKLFNLNAIWMVWLGRIFNVLLYACLAAYAVKKTPILKMPMLVFACLPLAVYLAASTSIDPFVNGFGLVAVAYFLWMYKAPEGTLGKRNIAAFTVLVLLLGMCKVTCFFFILLLFAVPRGNFRQKKYYFYGIAALILVVIAAAIWTRYYSSPGFLASWRGNKSVLENFNSTRQVEYILAHKKDTIIELAKMPLYLPSALAFNENLVDIADYLRLAFLGFVIFLYPHDIEKLKSRAGAFAVSLIFYIATYVSFLIAHTGVGRLDNYWPGVQARYFLPILALLPFIFGLNRDRFEGYDIDNFVILCVLLFLSFRCMRFVLWSY